MSADGPKSRLPLSYTRALDRLDEVVDPALLAQLQRWERPMVPMDPALPHSWRPVKTYVADPTAWYAGYLSIRADLEIPWELRRDLRERVPQALLRDMFRPSHRERPVEWVHRDSGIDAGARQAVQEGRAALLREPAPVIEMGAEVVAQEQARRRAFLRRPWQATLPDEAPRVHYTEAEILRVTYGGAED